ncbi:O-antigen ligase family protein [Phascolarctobacterium sp.]|uniref:O-antigen ligase family protein n=1 Tax=Phascolarctobacterium sp. TaxID=2049039 RepID=UPI003077B280
MNKISKILAVYVCIAVCFQRLSMAAGSIFWGISIALFLYLLHDAHKNDNLSDLGKNYYGYYKAIGIFFFCMLPSVLFSDATFVSTKKLFEMCVYRIMPFFMVTLFVTDKEWLKRIFLIFIAITGIDSFVALTQVFLGYDRGWGFGGNILNLASLLCVLMPILTVIILDNSFSKRTKDICKMTLILCLLGALAGKSRGAWLTLTVVLTIVSYTYVIKSKKAVISLLAICVLLTGFFATSDTYKNRLISTANITTDASNISRILIWKSGYNMLKDHPIVGVGLDRFKEIYNSGYRLPEMQYDLPHSHNNIVQIAAESGLIGLFGFLYLAGYIFFTNFNEWRQTKNPYSLMLWGSWLGFMIFGMFDLIIDHSAVTKALWFLFGALLVFKTNKFKI